MKEILFRGLTPEDKKSFEATLRHNALIRRLVEVLDQFERESAPKKVDYDKAAWPYYAADQNGYVRALRQIKSLLDHKED